MKKINLVFLVLIVLLGCQKKNELEGVSPGFNPHEMLEEPFVTATVVESSQDCERVYLSFTVHSSRFPEGFAYTHFRVYNVLGEMFDTKTKSNYPVKAHCTGTSEFKVALYNITEDGESAPSYITYER